MARMSIGLALLLAALFATQTNGFDFYRRFIQHADSADNDMTDTDTYANLDRRADQSLPRLAWNPTAMNPRRGGLGVGVGGGVVPVLPWWWVGAVVAHAKKETDGDGVGLMHSD